MAAEASMEGGLHFQREVFELVAERLRRQYGDASLVVSNFNRGPIDIVAKLVRTGPSISNGALEIAERIYIECKQRGRKIDMDAAGKAFCRAVIDRPDYLIIVSDTVLAPETVDYALKLFSCCTATQVVINNTCAPITNVKFLHYTLDELRGRASSANPGNRVPTLAPDVEVGWTLLEVDACGSERPVCGSDSPKAVHAARLDASYVLRMIVSFAAVPSRLPELWFTDDAGTRLDALKPQHMRTADTFLTVDFPVPTPDILRSVCSLAIDAGARGDHRVALQLPRLLLTDNRPLLGDFRAAQMDEIAAKIIAGTSALFLDGAGGLGKSHFGDGLCQRLVESGYSVRAHIWREDDDESVFYQLVLPTLFDGQGKGKSAFEALAASYVASLSDGMGTEAEPLSKNPNLLATAAVVCARALGEGGRRLMWCLQNCHEMSAAMVAALRTFIQQCRTLCPDARFILEYRTDEAGPAWREFVTETHANRYLDALSIQLKPIGYRALRDAVTRAMIGLDIGEFTRVLLDKTAGNPLFIESLLRHWMHSGYVLVRETAAGHKLHIESMAGIKAEIDSLPDDVRKFMVVRFARLIDHHAQGQALAALLYISSLMPRPPRLALLAEAAAASAEGLDALLRDCMAENLFRPSEEAGAVTFAHEFLRLGAQAAAKLHVCHAVAERLERTIDRTSGWECILAGRMRLGVKSPLEARDWFNRANSLLRDDYALLRLALSGLHAALDEIEPVSLQDRSGRVEVILDLAWAESQGGRMIDSRRTVAAALDEVDRLFDTHDEEQWRAARHFRARIHHRLVTVEIEMSLLANALDNFKFAIREVADATTLYHLSNRLVLAAEILGSAQVGWHASDISLKLADLIGEPDAQAVIRSDVGRLYAFASPGTALALWREGLDLANAPRQRTHAQADVLAARLACGEAVSEAEVTALRDAVRHTVPAQVPRLEMLIGACRYMIGDLDGATRAFGRAASVASLNGQLALRTGSLINHGLIGRLLAEGADPTPLHEAEACLEPFLGYGDDLQSQLGRALAGLETALDRLAPAAKSAAPHASLPPAAPSATSGILHMVSALQNVGLGRSHARLTETAQAHLQHCGYAAALYLPNGVPLIMP